MMPGACLRLALTFERLWNAADGMGVDHVCKQAVEAATVMIDDYLLPMALRVFGVAAMASTHRDAAAIANWVLLKRPSKLYTRELMRGSILTGQSNSSRIQRAVSVLENASWACANSVHDASKIGRKRNDYLLNPRVYEQ
ncbi:MAG: hypothetical protein RH946_01465 [Rhodospirillales bacterium]